MNRAEVRIIAAPAVAEALIGQLEAMNEAFTVTHVSAPHQARKRPGAVRRYVALDAVPGWASAEPRSATELAAELEAVAEDNETLNRLLDQAQSDFDAEYEENTELREDLAEARAENERLRNRLFGDGIDREEAPA